MLDDNPDATGTLYSADWKDRLRHQLGFCFPQIAETLTGLTNDRNVKFEMVKASSRSLCLKLNVDGKLGFLKLFDGPDGSAAFFREKMSLHSMLDSGLVPGLLAYSDELKFILTEWVETRSLLDAEPSHTAFRIGAWLAAFDAAAPAELASGNWFGYLSKFKTGVALSQIVEAKSVLSGIPLCGRVLSRNDPALHNYLQTQSGALLGCDFEQSRMRPRGWDYVTGFGALIERFPAKSNEVLEAYSAGFARSHRGALIVDELNSMARILFCARAVASRSEREAQPWQ
ncbi:hypothetical protein FEE96_16685 [Parasedimentitalea maritima]|uniref:Aminoglycoside phosphotransferase domain-containing protein n=1 Tax=Parasedimentitalea maritima TaxID=2578117 RepID=A0ABY2USG8_9RHOB|nr:hypothetical protein [Zongyanglinia marina]TLP60490.1 hypothetical protein FEE96_16685 [Zongyanglinia marina]